MKTLWQKTKAFRIIVLGLLIVFSATAPQGFLMLANSKVLPTIPWSLPLLVLYMALWIQFFRGKLIKSGASYRSTSFRNITVANLKLKWGLATGVLFGVSIFSSLFLMFQAMEIPLTSFALTGIPWYMSLSYIFMITAVAGISEEVGFRGYIQVPLESMYGNRAALIVTSICFLLAHLGHAEFNYLLPIYFIFSIVLGMVAIYSNSILPAIFIHFVFDFAVFNTFWMIGKERVTRQITDTGFTSLHWIMVTAIVAGCIGGWYSLKKLKLTDVI